MPPKKAAKPKAEKPAKPEAPAKVEEPKEQKPVESEGYQYQGHSHPNP